MKQIIFLIVCVLMTFSSELYGQSSEAEIGIKYYNSGSYNLALSHLQRAAKEGNIEVLQYLGSMFLNGNGTEKNTTAALNMYKRGVEHGDAGCLYGLAVMYENGKGVAKDEKKAFSYIKQAADKGHPSALDHLGYLYLNGIGTDKNRDLAVSYVQKAIESGCYLNCEWMASYCLEKKNYEKAFYYLSLKRERLSSKNKLLMAQMLHDGIGTPPSEPLSLPRNERKYPKSFVGKGINGKTYLAEALTIVDELVDNGFTEAEAYRHKWKAEYDEKLAYSNSSEQPKFTPEAIALINSIKVPPASENVGFHNRYYYSFIVRSSGQIDDIKAFCRENVMDFDIFNMKVISKLKIIPGTKGGIPVDMKLVVGLHWDANPRIKISSCYFVD